MYNHGMNKSGIALAVRGARLRRGWSQVELARVVGVRQSHVARIESGHDVRLSTLQRIFDKLGFALVVRAPDPRDLFAHPRPDSRIAEAQAFGSDLGQLYACFAMSPAQRLESAAANANGLRTLMVR